MKNTFKVLLICILTQPVFCQNLFPVKLDNCNTASFCLDCGDIKGGFDIIEFKGMLEKTATKLNLNGVSGRVHFQILIDSKGKGCVLSHTDESNSYITKTLIKNLNKFKAWTPASSEGEEKGTTSINIIIKIENNTLTGVVDRVDMEAFEESLRGSRPPEIYNEHYTYKNENLANYSITAWHRENSELPNDQNDLIAIDSSNILWYTMDNGLGILNNGSFSNSEQDVHPNEEMRYFSLAIDNSNTTWVSTSKGIYSFDGSWHYHEPAEIGIDGTYRIINNELSDEVYFCSDEGLTIYYQGEWSNINQDSISELPSNRVCFAKKDSKNRIWIGTYSGSIMIDSTGKVTSFNDTKTVLKNQCITSIAEDSEGNIYFGLYKFGGGGEVNRNEGIAKWSIDGDWFQYTTKNSGMPFNHTTSMAYDSSENVLWISTDRAGLIRYDLNEGWENYHSENSRISTSSISDLIIANNGVIYLGTKLGIVKIEKK